MTQGKAVRLGLIFLGAILSAGVAMAAGVYKWTDNQGNVQYSQTPPPSGDYTRLKGPPSPPSNPESEQKPVEAPATPNNQEQPATNPAEEKKRQAAVDEHNCAAARKNLEIYTASRSVLNDQGEVVRLDDEDRAAKIKQAEDLIQKHCK